MRRILILLGILGGIAAGACAVQRTAEVQPLLSSVRMQTSGVQRAAPDFIGETLDGRELALSELRGKPVVVNFWASWCAPCKLEMPVLSAAARRHAGRVHFVGVNVLDRLDDARRFARQIEIPFPSVYDDGSLLQAYQVVGLPTTVFITADGRVAATHAGPFVGEEGTRRLETYLAALLRP
ncbi:MAG: TlpA disulfide reductase family protein [Armatimonadota bacterium]|nr:TlpA disulfide reductase family protein [Armatimonadota bacterium]MDR5696875.1 TlpA disulfide reductase family protein [Armatimonadota bacterium]